MHSAPFTLNRPSRIDQGYFARRRRANYFLVICQVQVGPSFAGNRTHIRGPAAPEVLAGRLSCTMLQSRYSEGVLLGGGLRTKGVIFGRSPEGGAIQARPGKPPAADKRGSGWRQRRAQGEEGGNGEEGGYSCAKRIADCGRKDAETHIFLGDCITDSLFPSNGISQAARGCAQAGREVAGRGAPRAQHFVPTDTLFFATMRSIRVIGVNTFLVGRDHFGCAKLGRESNNLISPRLPWMCCKLALTSL